MMQRRALVALMIVTTVLAACGTLKKFTGQRNDTILPGERENVLPPEQQRNKRPGADKLQTPCDPAVDVDCPAAGPNDADTSKAIQ
jgi:hypothetical protein